jgi:16S rRNA C967 or C1407 C5-methylase (RsmB/RsmF family)/NOL1/NOP2/fmu family ribosome biogenesis protein
MQLPAEFVADISSLLKDEVEPFLASLRKEAPTSIRLNPAKTARNPMAFSESVDLVAWSQWGYLLHNRPAFTFDPLFHAGYYYVQEAASMFIEHIVRTVIDKPAVCLDLCAAPGGKSLAMLSSLPEGSLLVSNEIVRQRSQVLSETIIKSGFPNVVVTNNAPAEFGRLRSFFDLMLVDAPCSGEGMFRKDETAICEWSPVNVKMCAARQKEIVRDAWPALKPGGILVYSTCTYNRIEDEDNALWIASELHADFIEIPIKSEWNISPSFDEKVKGYRFFPHKTSGEGFFVTIVRKSANDSLGLGYDRKLAKKEPIVPLKDVGSISPMLNPSECFSYFQRDQSIIALPIDHADEMQYLMTHFKVVSAGIELGQQKGKSFVPSPALSLSIFLDKTFFVRYEVPLLDAIAFLRGEAIHLAEVPLGIVLLTCKNEPIGFVKNIGNRANNFYPNEWRIRSGYLPGTFPDFLRLSK